MIKKLMEILDIKPFYLLSNLDLFQINLKKIFEENSILINIIKSETIK